MTSQVEPAVVERSFKCLVLWFVETHWRWKERPGITVPSQTGLAERAKARLLCSRSIFFLSFFLPFIIILWWALAGHKVLLLICMYKKASVLPGGFGSHQTGSTREGEPQQRGRVCHCIPCHPFKQYTARTCLHVDDDDVVAQRTCPQNRSTHACGI